LDVLTKHHRIDSIRSHLVDRYAKIKHNRFTIRSMENRAKRQPIGPACSCQRKLPVWYVELLGMGAWVHGCMGAWVHGCMGAWVHGCMGAWVHGCMGAWVHGCMGAWVHGCMGAWVHGCMGAWVHGCMGAWVHGCQKKNPVARPGFLKRFFLRRFFKPVCLRPVS
jgi:hypothetical protein